MAGSVESADAVVVALTMGEPAGVGGELALKAWLRRGDGVPVFCVIDDAARLSALAKSLGLDVPVAAVAAPAAARQVWERALPVLSHSLAVSATAGRPDPLNAAAVLGAIERAVALAQAGEVAAIVTNPIHKATLYEAGFRLPGHTEYLGELVQATEPPVMMLACPGLRVVPVTVHLPLASAVKSLTREAIVRCGRVTAAALGRDFGIAVPRLAVAALNPHAGESDALGREERQIIAPAVAELRAAGIAISGPAPADSLFHAEARARYDAALCMYHDQALIPIKTIDFRGGVNITLGLPIVRTSPDHGTALDIAGRGIAEPDSLIAALLTAAEIARRRRGAGRQSAVA